MLSFISFVSSELKTEERPLSFKCLRPQCKQKLSCQHVSLTPETRLQAKKRVQHMIEVARSVKTISDGQSVDPTGQPDSQALTSFAESQKSGLGLDDDDDGDANAIVLDLTGPDDAADDDDDDDDDNDETTLGLLAGDSEFGTIRGRPTVPVFLEETFTDRSARADQGFQLTQSEMYLRQPKWLSPGQLEMESGCVLSPQEWDATVGFMGAQCPMCGCPLGHTKIRFLLYTRQFPILLDQSNLLCSNQHCKWINPRNPIADLNAFPVSRTKTGASAPTGTSQFSTVQLMCMSLFRSQRDMVAGWGLDPSANL